MSDLKEFLGEVCEVIDKFVWTLEKNNWINENVEKENIGVIHGF